MRSPLFCLSQSRRLPLLQVVSNNKSLSVGVQSPTEINAPRGCAVILRRICQLSLTRITHQVSRAFDLNSVEKTPISASSESGLRMSDLPCQTLRENGLIENFVQKNNLSP